MSVAQVLDLVVDVVLWSMSDFMYCKCSIVATLKSIISGDLCCPYLYHQHAAPRLTLHRYAPTSRH